MGTATLFSIMCTMDERGSSWEKAKVNGVRHCSRAGAEKHLLHFEIANFLDQQFKMTEDLQRKTLGIQF